MSDRQILSETLLKRLLALLDKQPQKDRKQLMQLLEKIMAETTTPNQHHAKGCW
jgi:hypothetical protein